MLRADEVQRERKGDIGGVINCLLRDCVPHIKATLRQSDDTKSLVSMILVTIWTG